MALPPAADGTFATYQGIGLVRCTFQRSRGWGSSSAVVEVLVSTLTAFGIDVPKPESIFQTRSFGYVPTPGARTKEQFAPSGALKMREVVNGEAHEVVVQPLYIVRAEVVRKADGSPFERVRLSLEDVRYFWPRGVIGRWSFNRRRSDGTIALDSVKFDGTPYTKAQMARELTGYLPGQPKLVAHPARWDFDTSAHEFPRYSLASAALARLVAQSGLEEPCLRLNGDVALHAGGEGFLGYAATTDGPNAQPFPARFVLDKNGQGRGRSIEPSYPEEYVIVAGGERVASVAVDDWEPVIQFQGGQIRPLNEALVRTLTGGTFGLDWLAKFVLQPTAYQSHPAIDSDVADLLADQAWRLYRLPGVEVYQTIKAGEGRPGLLAGQEAKAEDGAEAVVSGPGPNAHLLPLRPRAETANGRRLAPLVECYTFTTEHVRLRGTSSEERLTQIRREIQGLIDSIPPDTGSVRLLNTGGVLDAADVFRGFEAKLQERGVQIEDLEASLARVRAIEDIRGRGSRGAFVAEQLMRLEVERLEAEEAVGAEGGRSELFAAAVAIYQGEQALRDDLRGIARSAVSPGDERSFDEIAPSNVEIEEALGRRRDLQLAILARVEPFLVRAQAEREARRQRIEQTGTPATDTEAFGVVVLSNRPVQRDGAVEQRMVDVGARVVDDEAGLVRLSSLGGHVVPNGASDASQARFVPRAVRVTFGAVLRPRIDQAPPEEVPVQRETGQAVIVASGEATLAGSLDRLRAQNEALGDTLRQALARDRSAVVAVQPGGGQSIILDALTDQESWYTAAFRRTGRGSVQPVAISSVPLNRAVVVNMPDMVELLKLDGGSNRVELDRDARRIAEERANVYDMVTSERVVLARPWPVQCDGLVSSVTITMREKDGVPCGFETLVTTGTTAIPPLEGSRRTEVRPRLAPSGGAARREGKA